MMFIPTLNLDIAKEVSGAIFSLTRPQSVKSPDDVTQYELSVYAHPVNGQGLIQFPDDYKVYIYPDIVAAERLQSVLSSFVSAQVLSLESANAVVSFAEAHLGRVVDITEVIPPEFLAWSMTEDEARSAGFFS